MIPEYLLQQTKSFVAQRMGWDFHTRRTSDLERGLIEMARDNGVEDHAASIVQWLEALTWSDTQVELLTRYLTVGETYFFRENAQLNLFKNKIIPQILSDCEDNTRTIRIWSAGCCSGEEPYSLAILLKETIQNFDRWKISIVGTDINPKFLEKARKGIYTAWSFRETSLNVQQKYFKRVGNCWEIIPEIKRMVSFSTLNLAEDSYPSLSGPINNIDVIFCRNVLMYFTSEQVIASSRRFFQTLRKGGWLITSVTELNDNNFPDFSPIKIDNCHLYQKIPKQVNKMPHDTGLSSVGLDQVLPPITKKRLVKTTLPKGEIVAGRPIPKGVPVQVNGENACDQYTRGHYEQCIRLCLVSIEQGVDDRDHYLLLVKSYANLGRLPEARLWGEKLLAMNGFQPSDYYLVSTILTELGEYSDAEQILKKALYLEPHHILSNFQLGTVGMRLDKKSMGLKYFNNVLELLAPFQDSDLMPEADGITAGRLKEIVASFLQNS